MDYMTINNLIDWHLFEGKHVEFAEKAEDVPDYSNDYRLFHILASACKKKFPNFIFDLQFGPTYHNGSLGTQTYCVSVKAWPIGGDMKKFKQLHRVTADNISTALCLVILKLLYIDDQLYKEIITYGL